jgi:uncharacterized protein YegJ (DUF2314 family)
MRYLATEGMGEADPKDVVFVPWDAYRAGIFKHPAKWFAEKLIKARFRCLEDAAAAAELMWVRVTSTKRGEITGNLANQPFNATYLRYGDEVTLRPQGVLAVQD